MPPADIAAAPGKPEGKDLAKRILDLSTALALASAAGCLILIAIELQKRTPPSGGGSFVFVAPVGFRGEPTSRGATIHPIYDEEPFTDAPDVAARQGGSQGA